jgi:replicative DNA helicase
MTDDRVLPHDLDAERCVLGAMMIDRDAYLVAAQCVEERDFFRDAHRRVFLACTALHERGSELDLITIKDELARRGELDECGGPAYISALTDGIPRASNVEHYAKIVREHATRRNVIHEARRVLADAYEGALTGAATIESALHRLGTISTADVRELRQPVMSGGDCVERWATMPPISERVLPLGVSPAIDRQMRGGIEPGECMFIVARPGSLKTMLVLNVLRRWMARRPRELFPLVELEMPQRQLTERFARMFFQLSSEAVDERRIAGLLDIEGFKASIAGLRVVDEGAMGLRDIEQRIRLTLRQSPDSRLGGVVIDHCGLVRGVQGASSYDRATETAIGIKQLARRLEVPIVALVQANRTAAQSSRTGDPPEMEQARDSGAYEENADFMLTMSAIQPPDVASIPHVTIKLAKNRRGAEWITKLGFDGTSLRMAELDDQGDMSRAA